MKHYIRIVIITLLSITTLSAQESPLIHNQMDKPWKPNFSNSHVREPITTTNSQLRKPSTINKGSSYNILNTETKTKAPTPITLQNNNSNSYYQSYSINQNSTQAVAYNTPTQIQSAPPHTPNNVQTDNIVTTAPRKNALNRGDKPNDPSVPVPIGDILAPMLICALCWIICKLRTKNRLDKLA